jgi:carbon-monoxide dehydrogenase medium subunit
VKPAPFDYHAATSVEEAVALLAEFGDDAKVIAGGQSLVPMMALRLASFAHLVDVCSIPELRGVHRHDGTVTVRAATPDAVVEHDADVAAAVPLLSRVTPLIGHFQIRNRGTVGGALAHADPAAEYPAVALALDAELEVASTKQSRVISAADFFQGLWTTALESGELLAAVHFPVWSGRCGFAAEEFARRHGDFALAGAVAGVELDGDDVVRRAAIALFGVATTPVRARTAEAALVGRRVGELGGDEIGRLALEDVGEPSGDVHAPAAYRTRVARAMAARAWARAREEAGSQSAASDSAVPRRPPAEPIAERERVATGRSAATGGDADRVVMVNGAARRALVEPRKTLADFLRDDCHLTGTHLGCEHGVCGACTVLVDGAAVRSCLVFAVQVEGAEVTTIEGLSSPGGELSPVQEAFRAAHGLQCGFCTPGFIVSVTAFLADHPSPSDDDIRDALSGNLCRCTGYQGIVNAVTLAAGGAVS